MVVSMTISRTEALIALGANLDSAVGGPKRTLEAALDQVREEVAQVVQVSRWWRTPAFPAGSGPDFVNAVAVIEPSSDPHRVLSQLHKIEESLGRARLSRWEARVVDLDLLAYGDVVAPDRETVLRWMALSTAKALETVPSELLLPHPRLHERVFVLAPLVDVRPSWRHPLLDRTARDLLDAAPADARAGVEPIDETPPNA